MKNPNNENNSNNHNKKNPLIGLAVALFFLWLTFSILHGILDSFELFSGPILEPTSPIETTTPVSSEKIVGNMELIGCSREGVVVSPITFYYYRDVVTDQMFIVSYNVNNHTVTPMVHVDTGLPLTYAEYRKMEGVRNSAEGDDFLERDD